MSGIPHNVTDAELEDKVVGIINTITERTDDAAITSKDIHTCHRLKKEEGEENAKVIVRMVNRKYTVDVLKNKKKLRDNSTGFQNLYINENLCNDNKTIFHQARNLKKKKLIHACSTYNGIINFKKRENDRPKKIFHMADYESFLTKTS